MSNKTWVQGIISFILAALLLACGSGGYDSGGMDGTGSEQPSVATGEISAFGSVFVNGVEYETGHADIFLDDAPALEDDLKLGMVVTVTGTVDEGGLTGEAQKVEFRSFVRGPVTAVSAVDGDTVQITVLGEELLIGDDATLHNLLISQLVVGMVVKASGFENQDSVLVATHLERVADAYTNGDPLVLRGSVSELDTVQKQFKVNGVWVRYAAASWQQVSEAQLAEGMIVIVRGYSENGGEALDAVSIRRDRDFEDDIGDDVTIEIEGIVTEFESLADFRVRGRRVDAANATFWHGDADDVQPGARVSIKGELNDDGYVDASVVIFKSVGPIKLDGMVESIDTQARTFVLAGSTVKVDAHTRFQDQGAMRLRYFGFGDLRVGDQIEIRGVMNGDIILGTRIVRGDEDDEDDGEDDEENDDRDEDDARGDDGGGGKLSHLREVDLRGPVTAMDGNLVRVLNTWVDLSKVEQHELDAPIEMGDLVKVEGRLDSNGVLVAREIEWVKSGHD